MPYFKDAQECEEILGGFFKRWIQLTSATLVVEKRGKLK